MFIKYADEAFLDKVKKKFQNKNLNTMIKREFSNKSGSTAITTNLRIKYKKIYLNTCILRHKIVNGLKMLTYPQETSPVNKYTDEAFIFNLTRSISLLVLVCTQPFGSKPVIKLKYNKVTNKKHYLVFRHHQRPLVLT